MDTLGKRIVYSLVATAITEAQATFESLRLSENRLSILHSIGFLHPTPIQAAFIPKALEGLDVIGQAQTGTGKTAAFVLPILERIGPERVPQALVLVPTRELVQQVHDEVSRLCGSDDVRVAAIYGGQEMHKQTRQLAAGVQFVVGTPGRLLDHIRRGVLKLDRLRVVVLDEADRMLDIGFRPDIEKILRRCPRERQTLLLSATVPPAVERLAARYMRDHETLNFSPQDVSVETIEQFYFTVDPQQKFDLLVRLLKRDTPRQAIVFCRTKRGTQRIYQNLSKKFEGVDCMHGDLQQSARDRAMAKFREGKVKYLVATDVVGRGIDVSSISHIINYDIPEFCDDYVHRVGRTGRMGREGIAYTFVAPDEGSELTRIEMRINRLLERAHLEGYEPPAKTPAPAPAAQGPQASAPEAPPVKKPAPMPGGRTRRYRRAL